MAHASPWVSARFSRCRSPLPLRAVGALLLLSMVPAAGCIKRSESVEARRANFDREGLTDVVLQGPPAGVTGGGAVFEDGIRYRGFTLDPATPRPGDRVTVDLFWEVLEGPQDDWKVFVHLDPIENRGRRINADHEPAEGRYPTDVWRAGEVVRDRFEFRLPSRTDAVGFEMWIGFYQGKERLEVDSSRGARHDGSGRVLGGVIRLQ